MKNIYTFIMLALVIMSITACASSTVSVTEKSKNIQDIQIFTSANRDGKITTQSIETVFDANDLSVPGNNNMNKPFKTRFGKVNYKIYNLAMYLNNDLTFKLIKKYPSFGVLTPLTMSIWEDKDNSMNISTLTINGMARVTGIPVNDPDLIAYANLIHKVLKVAMPNGTFKELNTTVKFPHKRLATNFEMEVNYDGQSPSDFIDDFEAEFEAEMEPLGFLLPNYTNIQEEILDDHGYTGVYDFYHTYSICKLDVIYPVSKNHPEAGAWAPCSFYIYKKTNENKMHMGFLSVENWIISMDMKDNEEGTKKLHEAQGYIEKIINDMMD